MDAFDKAAAKLADELRRRRVGLRKAKRRIAAHEQFAAMLQADGAFCDVCVTSHHEGDATVWINSYADKSVLAALRHASWRVDTQWQRDAWAMYLVAVPGFPCQEFNVLLRAQLDERYLGDTSAHLIPFNREAA